MKVNSEAIYSTRKYSSFDEGENIRFTQSKDGKTQYVFLFSFPQDKIAINKIPFSKKTTVQMLGATKMLKWSPTANGTEIIIPAALQKTTEHVGC